MTTPLLQRKHVLESERLQSQQHDITLSSTAVPLASLLSGQANTTASKSSSIDKAIPQRHCDISHLHSHSSLNIANSAPFLTCRRQRPAYTNACQRTRMHAGRFVLNRDDFDQYSLSQPIFTQRPPLGQRGLSDVLSRSLPQRMPIDCRTVHAHLFVPSSNHGDALVFLKPKTSLTKPAKPS